MKKLVITLFGLAALSGCDVASDMAGEAIKGEIRTQYLAQCEGIAESSGIAAERVGAACECSADEFAEDLEADGQLQVDQARIEEVLKICVQDSGEAAPAEE